jgi:hypothetical protein
MGGCESPPAPGADLSHLDAALRQHHFVSRQFTGFAVEFHAEALRQQVLQHQPELISRGP